MTIRKFIFAGTMIAFGLTQCRQREQISDRADEDGIEMESDSSALAGGELVAENTSQTAASSGDASAVAFIKTFYEEYVLALENNLADVKRKEFCTTEVVEKFSSEDLDYDPFLNAQDIDENLLATLYIRADDQDGYYVVSYVDGYSKEKVYIIIGLERTGDSYKISDVSNDVGAD